jgi:hypothetical protein
MAAWRCGRWRWSRDTEVRPGTAAEPGKPPPVSSAGPGSLLLRARYGLRPPSGVSPAAPRAPRYRSGSRSAHALGTAAGLRAASPSPRAASASTRRRPVSVARPPPPIAAAHHRAERVHAGGRIRRSRPGFPTRGGRRPTRGTRGSPHPSSTILRTRGRAAPHAECRPSPSCRPWFGEPGLPVGDYRLVTAIHFSASLARRSASAAWPLDPCACASEYCA